MKAITVEFANADIPAKGLRAGYHESGARAMAPDNTILDMVISARVAIVSDLEEDGRLSHACKSLAAYRARIRPFDVKELVHISDDEIEDVLPASFAIYVVDPETFPRRPLLRGGTPSFS